MILKFHFLCSGSDNLLDCGVGLKGLLLGQKRDAQLPARDDRAIVGLHLACQYLKQS